MSYGIIVAGANEDTLQLFASRDGDMFSNSLLVCPGTNFDVDASPALNDDLNWEYLRPKKVGSMLLEDGRTYSYYRVDCNSMYLIDVKRICEVFGTFTPHAILMFPASSTTQDAFGFLEYSTRSLNCSQDMTAKDLSLLAEQLRPMHPVGAYSVMMGMFYGNSISIIWCLEYCTYNRIKQACHDDFKLRIIKTW